MTNGRSGKAGQSARVTTAVVVGLLAFIGGTVWLVRVLQEQSRPHTLDTQPPLPLMVAYPPRGTAPLRVRLDATGSTDNAGVTGYHWDFDDGTTGEGSIVDHVYATAGAFHPRVLVEDAAGLAGSISQTIDVEAPFHDRKPPKAHLQVSSGRGAVPLTLHFDASASTDDHGITLFRWSFDDGSTSEGAIADHTFDVPGRYDVTLTVADASGHFQEATQEIIAEAGPRSAAPVAVMHATPEQPTAPAEILFDGRASHDDQGIVAYHWDFGDSHAAVGPVVTHRYTHEGKFLATLTVYDASGQASRVSQRVRLLEPQSVTERVLFDDDWTTGAKPLATQILLEPTQDAHTGRQALHVKPAGNGSLEIRLPSDRLDAYDRLGFWVKSDHPERLAVRAILAPGKAETNGPLDPIQPRLLPGAGGALQGVWRRAAVPLVELAADHKAVAGFVIQATDGMPLPEFFLDDVSLLPPDVTLPVLSECTDPQPIRGFVERRDGMLYADGVPFRAVGANLYYMQQELSRHVQTGEIRPLAHVRSALSAAVCTGINVVRLLGFNDSPPETQDSTIIQTAPGVLREEGLRGLDLAIAEARAHNLRVILTLTNNWSAYGGIPRYAEWAHVEPELALGDSQVREWVIDYARQLALRVNSYTGVRYKDDPTILAVELANELRCHGCDADSNATAFSLALAKGVAAAWPNHLIADGGEGFDDKPSLYPGLEVSSVVSGAEGASFHTLAQAPEIDLVSYHLYPESWKLSDEQAIQYIDAHESIAHAAGKVAYMGEFGVRGGDGLRAFTYNQWLERLFSTNGGSLGLVWQLTYAGRPDNDGFALVPGQSEQAMAAIARQARLLATPGLDGVSVAYVRK